MENANRPAFPISEEETDRIDQGISIYSSLTKREEIAKCAMQGLLSGIYSSTEMTRAIKVAADKTGDRLDDFIAVAAIECADALLKKLEEKKP